MTQRPVEVRIVWGPDAGAVPRVLLQLLPDGWNDVLVGPPPYDAGTALVGYVPASAAGARELARILLKVAADLEALES